MFYPDLPILRCPCGAVGVPRISPGTSAHTVTASCARCQAVLKQLPRLMTTRPAEVR